MGSTASIDSLANSDEIIILDRPRVPARSLRVKMPIAIGTTIGIVTLAPQSCADCIRGLLRRRHHIAIRLYEGERCLRICRMEHLNHHLWYARVRTGNGLYRSQPIDC